MADLGFSLKETDPSVNNVFLADLHGFLNPGNALKPNQFQGSARISDFCYQPPGSLFADRFHTCQSSDQLNEICLRRNICDQVNLRSVQIAVRKMLQKITERKDSQFLFQ